LLIPTKDQDGEDEGDSLSMMQSFCLQVFLIRLTSMITNEDKRAARHAHYKNLVRRNQNGLSSLKDLYILCSLDILQGTRKNLTPDQIEEQIRQWFEGQMSKVNLEKYYEANHFKPGTMLECAQTVFASNEQNQSASIALALKEKNE